MQSLLIRLDHLQPMFTCGLVQIMRFSTQLAGQPTTQLDAKVRETGTLSGPCLGEGGIVPDYYSSYI